MLLQAFALGDFPAPMSLGAITSLIGAFMTAIFQFLEDHEVKTSWLLVRSGDLIGFFILVIPTLSRHFICKVPMERCPKNKTWMQFYKCFYCCFPIIIKVTFQWLILSINGNLYHVNYREKTFLINELHQKHIWNNI